MQRLFLFLYQFRAFIVFTLLELVCVWLIVQNNQYQSAAFFNSSNYVVGSFYDTYSDINGYFKLGDVNKELAGENAALKERLLKLQKISEKTPALIRDSTIINQYNYFPAKVINNSISRSNNYITINKGSGDGIAPGMGVISAKGVVGRVKATSLHFSTITSLLHSSLYISSRIKSSGTFCSTKWDGRDPHKASLLYVPRHIKVNIGDTVITSGYNAIFPENVMIGKVESFDIKGDATFYDITIVLNTDFSKLSYVYVIENKLKNELDTLEQNLYITNE